MKYIFLFLLIPGCLNLKSPAHKTEAITDTADVVYQAPIVESELAKVTFITDVEPILKLRCQPCHFEGGKMYSRLPFDTASTILEIGEHILTRIKDPEEAKLIREFLNTQAD